jgi:hypothetical protein
MLREHNPKTLHVISHDFYVGYQQASLDFELKYKPHVGTFDDIQITTIFTQVAYGTGSDLWKAGYHAGLFAALYGIPCVWMHATDASDLHYGINGIRRAS